MRFLVLAERRRFDSAQLNGRTQGPPITQCTSPSSSWQVEVVGLSLSQ